MKKELVSNSRKFNFVINFAVLSLVALLLCGCGAALDYAGSDYSSNNVETVKTNEDFVFKTYTKKVDNANIKTGISKTPIMEVLVLYVKVENLSYETPYTFRVSDLRLNDSDGDIQFITSSNYLNIFQGQEAQAMSAMSAVGSTFTNMAGLANNYNEYNQSMARNAAEDSTRGAFTQMEQKGNQILKHSIKNSAQISPRKSQYFYFFFENRDNSPINVNYKGLNYQFKI